MITECIWGIWDAEKITDVDAVEVGAMDLWMDQDVSLASLEAQVAPGQLTRAEPALRHKLTSGNHGTGTDARKKKEAGRLFLESHMRRVANGPGAAGLDRCS